MSQFGTEPAFNLDNDAEYEGNPLSIFSGVQVAEIVEGLWKAREMSGENFDPYTSILDIIGGETIFRFRKQFGKLFPSDRDTRAFYLSKS